MRRRGRSAEENRRRRDARADGGEVWQAIILESDDVKALEVFASCVLFKFGQHAADEFGPYAVLLGGVGVVTLLNDVGCSGGKRFGSHRLSPRAVFDSYVELEIAACLLLPFDGFKQRLEVAFAEAAASLALNDFKEERG